MPLYRPLAILATLLAFGVVALGAYVRLSDAGLGCPDWPGCYGHWLGVPEAAHEQAAASQAFPGKPVNAGRAWKEMVHRYFAGTLGLLILALCVLAWRHRQKLATSPALPTLLLGIVTFQALLGMWTVTLLLKPVIVSAHLLGGMTTLSLLVWLSLRRGKQRFGQQARTSGGIRLLALLALTVGFAQIALGGWVSSNYAALACPDFPTCKGAWLPEMDFGHAFSLHRELGQTADGAHEIVLAAREAAQVPDHAAHLLCVLEQGRLGVRQLLTLPRALVERLRDSPHAHGHGGRGLQR